MDGQIGKRPVRLSPASAFRGPSPAGVRAREKAEAGDLKHNTHNTTHATTGQETQETQMMTRIQQLNK